MRYRKLGATGITVSEIGFGTWGLGGSGRGAVAYGPTDDAESSRALRVAFDEGVTFYDTADLYGFGHSEALLGAALGSVRERVVIATKAGFTGSGTEQNFTSEYLSGALEASLRRLGTDWVDVFQLHDPPIDLLLRDDRVLGCLERLRRDGKARSLGISVRSPQEGVLAAERLDIGCLQVNFNLVDQRALESGLLAACERRNLGVIVRTPLCFGFLTGKYEAATRFDEFDHRNRWSLEQRQRWADALGIFVTGLRTRLAQTPAQLALRFCLSFGAVSTVIPGMLTAEHVTENARASDMGPLADEDRAAIQETYAANAFYVGG